MIYIQIILNRILESLNPILNFKSLIILVALSIIMIIFRLFQKRKDKIEDDRLDVHKRKEVDMDNIFNSINQSKELYKKLSKECHPDKFIGTEKYHLAEEIFQNLVENKRNHQELLKIKSRINKELNK